MLRKVFNRERGKLEKKAAVAADRLEGIDFAACTLNDLIKNGVVTLEDMKQRYVHRQSLSLLNQRDFPGALFYSLPESTQKLLKSNNQDAMGLTLADAYDQGLFGDKRKVYEQIIVHFFPLAEERIMAYFDRPLADDFSDDPVFLALPPEIQEKVKNAIQTKSQVDLPEEDLPPKTDSPEEGLIVVTPIEPGTPSAHEILDATLAGSERGMVNPNVEIPLEVPLSEHESSDTNEAERFLRATLVEICQQRGLDFKKFTQKFFDARLERELGSSTLQDIQVVLGVGVLHGIIPDGAPLDASLDAADVPSEMEASFENVIRNFTLAKVKEINDGLKLLTLEKLPDGIFDGLPVELRNEIRSAKQKQEAGEESEKKESIVVRPADDQPAPQGEVLASEAPLAASEEAVVEMELIPARGGYPAGLGGMTAYPFPPLQAVGRFFEKRAEKKEREAQEQKQREENAERLWEKALGHDFKQWTLAKIFNAMEKGPNWDSFSGGLTALEKKIGVEFDLSAPLERLDPQVIVALPAAIQRAYRRLSVQSKQTVARDFFKKPVRKGSSPERKPVGPGQRPPQRSSMVNREQIAERARRRKEWKQQQQQDKKKGE